MTFYRNQFPQPHRLGRVRRGTTIIEVMGLTGLLLLIGTTSYRSLGTVTRVSKQNQHSRVQRTEVDRLARTIRHDLHGADAVAVVDGTIQIKTNAGEIGFRWDDAQSTLFRSVTANEQVQAVDRFRLHSDMRFSAEVEDASEDQKLLRLNLSLRSLETDPPTWVIEAAL